MIRNWFTNVVSDLGGAPRESRKEPSITQIWAPKPRFLRTRRKVRQVERGLEKIRNHMWGPTFNYVSQTWPQISLSPRATSWNPVKRLQLHPLKFKDFPYEGGVDQHTLTINGSSNARPRENAGVSAVDLRPLPAAPNSSQRKCLCGI